MAAVKWWSRGGSAAARPPRDEPGEGKYAGYGVIDPLGQKIGRLERLFVDGEGEAKNVMVRIGLFGKAVLIPVQAVVADEQRRTLKLR